MKSTALDYPVVKFLNHVLADYPLARELLKGDAGKTIEATIGPATGRLRVSQHGEFELIGRSTSAANNLFDAGQEAASAAAPDAAPDVAFHIPVSLLPRLAGGDESAFSEVTFFGNSEFASTLSTIARNVKWDVEEDLSHVVGDIAARRLVGGASAAGSMSQEAQARFLDNVAEYLTEEKRAFASKRDLEYLAGENENMRDAVARLEAKINAALKSVGSNVEG